MQYVLALDQGTTSSRAILFNRDGKVCSSAQQEIAQIFPQPGWVEHDPMVIWQSQLSVARACILQLAGHQSSPAKIVAKIKAVGIANQRETTLLWDRKTGEPVANAIVWQDRRTAGRCDTLRDQGYADMIQQKTGLMLDAYFSGTKLQWLLENIPGVRQCAERGELAFGTVDTWLIWNLTGGTQTHDKTQAHTNQAKAGGALHVTDASNAARTLLFNIHTGDWDADLLKLFNIPRAVLPQVVASSGIVGYTQARIFGAPLCIAGVAGDQQAALFGQACFAPGMAKNTYGTGCFMLMNTGTNAVPSSNRLLTTIAWQGPPGVKHATAYGLEGGVFMAGATVQWLRDGLNMIDSASEIEALAETVDDTGDVYLVPAFAGLGAPDWDGYARGALVGLTRGTTRAHIARAALESIALQVTDVFAAMERDAGIRLKELRVDGGACRNNLLMQMQADFLGVPVVRPQVTETTALGVAYLAGLATQFWKNSEQIMEQWAVERRFLPNMSDDVRRRKLARWRQAIDRARDWIKP